MKAVITADIVNSSSAIYSAWNEPVKKVLQQFGKQGKTWEIYRGDEIQILITNIEQAFYIATCIRAILKTEKLDARISIGLGEVDYVGNNVKESNGTAFIHSGRNLEEMKVKKAQNISIKSDFEDFDENFNLIFLLLEATFDRWTPSSANAVQHYLENQDLSQQEISEKMGISQGALSRAFKRANLEAINETDQYFRKKIVQL